MDVQVNIDAAAVEQQVTDAILKSALGERINEAIKLALAPNRHSLGSKSPIDDAIVSEVQQQVRIICREEIRRPNSDVRKMIEVKLTEALTQEAVAAIIQRFVTQLGLSDGEDIGLRGA